MDPSQVSVKEEESTVTDVEWRAMQNVLAAIYDYREGDHDPSRVFHRKVNRRTLPQYYDVIKEPMALSTVKAGINTRAYKKFSAFVRDFALIPHNAQLYNRPEAPAYQDALVIKSVLEAELQKLVEQKIISAQVAILPDLGEIPPPSPRAADDEGEEEEDEEEEEEDDGDESEEEGGRRRRRRGPRSTAAITKREAGGPGPKPDEHGKTHEAEARKKRGRPPRVDTPLESRIKAITKGLRKFKGPGGELKVSHFEKLPDKTLYPGYYTEIKHPMALDLIKRKSKRKKYTSVDHLMEDIEMMFRNAQAFNREDSQVYRDAVDLQREARALALQEKQKPDSHYLMEDGRLPLPNGILHNGEIWKVGDWVHIQNGNDLGKPIVAQIYRTWQDGDGQKWVNACWYYRPEQTVHRFERHFYEHEVVKTGQYRDHNIDEVLERCFVMFFTRFNKGRPRAFPPDKAVYVCESRYNEEKFRLNKIKTWASCLPDEVRDVDYEMDLFESPRRMRKLPSPIKHLLAPDAAETDELPQPTWGVENAPPVVGAVHMRPREPNESPPPEPTPSPPPPPPPAPLAAMKPPALVAPMSNGHQHHHHHGGAMGTPTPMPVYQLPPAPYAHETKRRYKASPSPALSGPAPHGSSRRAGGATAAGDPAYGSRHAPSHRPLVQPVSFASGGGYASSGGGSHHAYRSGSRGAATTTPRMIAGGGPSSSYYQPPKPVEVYHLTESVNNAVPADIRAQFQCDDRGRVLFFTAPPLDPVEAGWVSLSPPLQHSARYLAEKARREALVRDEAAAAAAAAAAAQTKKRKANDEGPDDSECSARPPAHKKGRLSPSSAAQAATNAMADGNAGRNVSPNVSSNANDVSDAHVDRAAPQKKRKAVDEGPEARESSSLPPAHKKARSSSSSSAAPAADPRSNTNLNLNPDANANANDDRAALTAALQRGVNMLSDDLRAGTDALYRRLYEADGVHAGDGDGGDAANDGWRQAMDVDMKRLQDIQAQEQQKWQAIDANRRRRERQWLESFSFKLWND
ncbi:MAG: hypothetical protein M1826_001714 [Phylliscum demangeonii]|nr:MAG: hypothetical protein M1826_001714 [Phylliscum demangeonii]